MLYRPMLLLARLCNKGYCALHMLESLPPTVLHLMGGEVPCLQSTRPSPVPPGRARMLLMLMMPQLVLIPVIVRRRLTVMQIALPRWMRASTLVLIKHTGTDFTFEGNNVCL